MRLNQPEKNDDPPEAVCPIYITLVTGKAPLVLVAAAEAEAE